MLNSIFRLDDRHLRGSTASDLKLPPESDTDSIADYADGENAGKVQIQDQNTILMIGRSFVSVNNVFLFFWRFRFASFILLCCCLTQCMIVFLSSNQNTLGM